MSPNPPVDAPARPAPMLFPAGMQSSASTPNLGQPHFSLQDIPVDISRMLYMLYQDVEHQITRADHKAQITLGTSTLLAALSVNLGLGVGGSGGLHPLEWVAVLLYICCAGSIFAAIGFAVTAAYPRSFGKGKSPNGKPNLYFTADIIQLPPDEYVARFLNQTNETLKESVLKQVQIKGRVLERKLCFIRLGLRALVFSIVFWSLAHVVLLATYGRLTRG